MKLSPETELEKYVASVFEEEVKNKGISHENLLNEILAHGCSEVLPQMVRYQDTIEFYKKFKAEINSVLAFICDDCGTTSMKDIFGGVWDANDPLSLELNNMDLLARFGFEETARVLCFKARIEFQNLERIE